MTNHHDFHTPLKAIWDKAVKRYEAGNREAATYFTKAEMKFLKSIGHTAQEVYDFAEDQVKHGEPDCETFLLVAAIRRYYHLHVMKGKKGNKIVDTGDLPPKTEAFAGIEWLPRIIGKAQAKLRGEMSDDLMYGCGGDRDFFKTHNIHAAEFLMFVMQHFDDDKAIIDFVVARSPAGSPHPVGAG